MYLQSSSVEKHDQSMISLHPLKEQRRRTRGLLLTVQISTLEEIMKYFSYQHEHKKKGHA